MGGIEPVCCSFEATSRSAGSWREVCHAGCRSPHGSPRTTFWRAGRGVQRTWRGSTAWRYGCASAGRRRPDDDVRRTARAGLRSEVKRRIMLGPTAVQRLLDAYIVRTERWRVAAAASPTISGRFEQVDFT